MKVISYILVIAGLLGLVILNWQLCVPAIVLLFGVYLHQREKAKNQPPPPNG
jgi:hypothetical protein